MIKPSLYLDPFVANCPLNGVPSGTYVCDVLFSHCNIGCENCPVLPGVRFMESDKVINAINQAVEFATEHVFSQVFIRLVGGDALRDWERFQKLCEYVEKVIKTIKIPIILNVVTCGLTMDDSKQSWLCERAENLRITYRWNDSQGLDVYKRNYVFSNSICSNIDWCVTRKSIPSLYCEVSYLLEQGKTVSLEYPDLNDWDNNTLQEFNQQIFQLLKRNQSKNMARIHFNFSKNCYSKIRNKSFFDIDNKNIPCRYFSSERLLFSTAESALQETASVKDNTVCFALPIYEELRHMRCRISESLKVLSSMVNDSK